MFLEFDQTNSNDYFKNGLKISVAVHILLILFFSIQVIFFNKPKLDLSQAIRVDMVGLPNKIDSDKMPEKIEDAVEVVQKPNQSKELIPDEKIKKTEKLPEKSKPTENKQESNAVNLKKVKNKQKEALEKLKKLSAIEKIKQDLKKEALNKIKTPSSSSSKTLVKGHVISAGSALTGLDKLDANTYLIEVDKQVKEQWALPQWLMNKPLKAQILVKFDQLGKIISNTILQSSGNPSYDKYCQQAVEQAAPFPKVPEKFTEKFSVDGVVIGFPE